MKRRIMIPLMLAIASPAVIAVDQPCRKDITQVDTNKYCVYSEKLYSLGAIVAVGDQLLECRYFPEEISGVAPGARWDRM